MKRLSLTYYLTFVFALAVTTIMAGGDAVAAIITQIVVSLGLLAVWWRAARH